MCVGVAVHAVEYLQGGSVPPLAFLCHISPQTSTNNLSRAMYEINAREMLAVRHTATFDNHIPGDPRPPRREPQSSYSGSLKDKGLLSELPWCNLPGMLCGAHTSSRSYLSSLFLVSLKAFSLGGPAFRRIFEPPSLLILVHSINLFSFLQN